MERADRCDSYTEITTNRGKRGRSEKRETGGRETFQHFSSWTVNAPVCCASCCLSVNALDRGFHSQTHNQPPLFYLNLNVNIENTVLKQQVTQNGVQHAEQRGSRARQAAQTPVAATQDSHPDQAALQLGHGALPVPQQDPGEAATRAEKNPHVLALLGETVTFFPSKVSKLAAD